MQTTELTRKIALLPPQKRAALNDYIDTLLRSIETTTPSTNPPKAIFGSAKGKLWMADDFDAPLEDFKEYM